MRVIAIEMGFYQGSRVRIGTEFEYHLDGDKLPAWVVPANPESRANIKSEAEAKRAKDLAALVAAAGPKRNGQPGAIPVNTGLANAVGESAPGKAVTPSWYKPTPNEEAVAGVQGAPAPAPEGNDALSDLA